MWPSWPQYLHISSLFLCSFSSVVKKPCFPADDTSISPTYVPVAVEGNKVSNAKLVVTVVEAAGRNLVVYWLVGLVLIKLARFAEFKLILDWWVFPKILSFVEIPCITFTKVARSMVVSSILTSQSLILFKRQSLRYSSVVVESMPAF